MKKENDFGDSIGIMLRAATRFKHFPVSVVDMERFLALLHEMQPIDLWDLTKKSDIYIRVILSLLFVLEKNGFVLIGRGGKLRLTKEGEGLAKYLSIKKIKKVLL